MAAVSSFLFERGANIVSSQQYSSDPIGGRFFRRQRIKMPAYGDFVPDADVDALAAWVRWIRSGAWPTLVGSPDLQ